MHGGESSLLLATPLWPALIFEKKIFSTTLNLILFFRAIGPRCIIYLLTFSNQILKVTWPKIYIKITVILICYGETPLGENRLAWGIEPRTLVKTCQTSKGFIYFCFLTEYFLFMLLFPLPRGTFTRIFKIDTSPHNLPLLPTPSHHCWSLKIKVKKTAD